MNKNTSRSGHLSFSLLLLMTLACDQAQSCEMAQDDWGRTIYRDCFLIDEQVQIKMPNLQIKSAHISSYPGQPTGIEVGFEITNSGLADSDAGLLHSMFSQNNSYGSFNVESTVYAVSEDHSFNMHYDDDTQQWMPYSQETHRINRLAAGDTQAFYFGNAFSPRYFLRDRSMTYKLGLLIKVDEPNQTSASTQGQSHGEVIESNESDNTRSMECLLYGDNIKDLSEILHIRHFHINNDLELPMVGRC